MSINLWAVITVVITGVTYYLITRLGRVGTLRGAGISGWISSYIALPELLRLMKFPTEKAATIVHYFGIVAVISILMIWASSDRPDVYRGIFGKLYYYIPRVGAVLWIAISILLQILK